jgi:uncharacterized protein YbcI
METPEHLSSTPERGAVASQISREIVQLHANLYGRGPTKAKTYVNDDYILCMLEDVFTPAERTLVRADKQEHVQATRSAFQDAVSDQFIAIVERASGRNVRAFMSMVHLDPEMSAELFALDPIAPPGANGPEADGNSPTADGAGPARDGSEPPAGDG